MGNETGKEQADRICRPIFVLHPQGIPGPFLTVAKCGPNGAGEAIGHVFRQAEHNVFPVPQILDDTRHKPAGAGELPPQARHSVLLSEDGQNVGDKVVHAPAPILCTGGEVQQICPSQALAHNLRWDVLNQREKIIRRRFAQRSQIV